MTSGNPIPATQLYAEANGSRCQGDHRCYWCGSPCTQLLRHHELPRPIGTRSSTAVKVPASPYVCVGCWMFQASSITARFMNSGDLKDRQKPSTLSWWITGGEAKAVRTFASGHVHSGQIGNPKWEGHPDHQALWEKVFSPPPRFALALVSSGVQNLLQLNRANDLPEVKMGTPLNFTVDNVPYTYSPYELREAFKNGTMEGKEPGTRKLVEFMGPPPSSLLSGLKDQQQKPNRVGRPGGMSGNQTPQMMDAKQLQQPVKQK